MQMGASFILGAVNAEIEEATLQHARLYEEGSPRGLSDPCSSALQPRRRRNSDASIVWTTCAIKLKQNLGICYWPEPEARRSSINGHLRFERGPSAVPVRKCHEIGD
jgi:hypothetical protein